jgi:RimJ/RimL family protein N-acetyltransferase
LSTLRLTVYEDAARFVVAAGAFLHAAEVENSIIATPAARIATAPNDDDAGSYLATVSDDREVVAAAFHGASGGILLTAAPEAAVTLIAKDLADRGRKPKSLVGPLAQCEAFARAWREQTGQAHVLRFHLRHFELTQSPGPHAAEGQLRRPETSEHSLVADWQLAFLDELELFDELPSARRNLARRIERGLVRVWDDGGAVAFVGFGEGAAATARIAPVYTPPRFRGRGYASAMVGALSRELFAAGKRAIFLTTDVANTTSNNIYQRIGFRPAADHFHFEFVSPQA